MAAHSSREYSTGGYSTGVALGAGAYLTWGMFPAFFGLLAAAGAVEILAHRVVWTLALMLVVLVAFGRLGDLRAIAARKWAVVATASTLIAVNWGTYVYAVTSGHVVEAALGYFINPLVSVVAGVIFFRERLGRAQLVAVAIAVVAVLVLTASYGKPPVLALTIAFSFAGYGVTKKVVGLDPRTSLTAEGVVAVPFAVAYLVYLAVTGTGTFLGDGAAHTVLLVATGPVTALPLLLFGGAAQRVPLVTMGMLQYLTPVLQFIWGVAVTHEAMPGSRWAGFTLIWLALAVFSADVIRRARARRAVTDTAADASTEVSVPGPRLGATDV